MNSKKKRLSASRLCLILDKAVCGRNRLERILKDAIKGGADIVQFRDKVSTTKTMIGEARGLLKIARQNNVPFLINDRLDVAAAVDADGLHLGQDDMPPDVARKILGRGKIIGLSCHSVKDIKAGQKEDVDYFGFGPVFKTETKPLMKSRGVAALQKALDCAERPVFAIGGITEEKIAGLPASDKLAVAVCREICLARDVARKTQRLKRKISRCTKI